MSAWKRIWNNDLGKSLRSWPPRDEVFWFKNVSHPESEWIHSGDWVVDQFAEEDDPGRAYQFVGPTDYMEFNAPMLWFVPGETKLRSVEFKQWDFNQ